MWVLRLLKEPYPLNSIPKMTSFAAFVAGFVFLFLTFFQPFGLGGGDLGGLIKVTATYGLITFFTVVLATLLIRTLFPAYFKEKHWTFGRELLITLLNILLIGLFNTLYSNFMFRIGLNFNEFLLFLFYTLGVGFFPVVFFMFLKYTRLLRSNVHTAESLSGSISKAKPSTTLDQDFKLSIHSELKKDDLEIFERELVYAETADNYIAVYHLIEGKLEKSMVRSTLGRLETDLSDRPNLVRCHRAFLVNLEFLESFKGNAQGLQLRLRNTPNEIPVSRNRMSKIKSMLE
jgi:hypothetical protein